ncbi:MAG: hypothetical protein AB1757_19435 [Acidobacteriota bacterium]
MAKGSEQKKLIFLGILGAALVGVLIYQLFFSGPPPRPTLANSNRSATPDTRSSVPVQNPESAAKVAQQSGRGNGQEAEFQELLSDNTPLQLAAYKPTGSPAVSERGNIFEYWVKPPPPPRLPDPPPPITIVGVNPQSATAGTPRSFTLTVYVKNSPADAEVLLDGRAKPTKRVNDGALTVEMTPGDYAYQKSINVEVKSKSEPVKQYSNSANFAVTPTPEPPFRFIGILGEQGVLEIGQSKEVLRVRVGDKIQSLWRVDSIAVGGMELTHLQFDIKRRLPLQEKPK